MEYIYKDYPDIMSVYVMSDVYEYYKKQSYTTAGTIFEVKN